MIQIKFLGVHRNWEDWLIILLGTLISVSPWIPGEMSSHTAMSNAVILGLVLFVLGELEATDLHRWQEGCVIALGLWLGASPFVFGYSESGSLRFWHFTLALIVIILGAVELLQDWKLSDQELANHEN